MRGKKGTSDLVLKIMVGETISELQLVIDLNVSEYEFAHKIYELTRSKFHSTLSMVKHMNEELSGEFAAYINKLIKANEKH